MKAEKGTNTSLLITKNIKRYSGKGIKLKDKI